MKKNARNQTLGMRRRERERGGAAEKRSVDRLVLAVSVFVVGARLFDRPDICICNRH